MKIQNPIPQIPQMVKKYCTRFSKKPAMVLENGQQISYGDMFWDISRTAATLRNTGSKKNRRIVIFADSTPQSIETFYAVLTAGAVPVLLRYDLSENEVAGILNEQKPDAIFIRSENISLIGSYKEAAVFEMADNRILKDVDMSGDMNAFTEDSSDESESAAIIYSKGIGPVPEKKIMTSADIASLAKKTKKTVHSVDALIEYIRFFLSALRTGRPVLIHEV